jgi:hypothetical protein
MRKYSGDQRQAAIQLYLNGDHYLALSMKAFEFRCTANLRCEELHDIDLAALLFSG